MQGMTAQQWGALGEDDARELVDGRLEAGEMPDLVHEIAVFWLARQPDACVFATRRPPSRGLVDVPPDIVVEVLSPSLGDQRRDRIAKVDEYARFGVAQYWLLDPSMRALEILVLQDGRYARAVAATEGVVEVPGFPELCMDLDALWSELDAL